MNTHTKKYGLARIISKRGIVSRSEAEKLIKNGMVTLNGTIITDPEYPASLVHARINIQNILEEQREKVYIMLNKPKGVVTTRSDEKNRPTIYSLLTDIPTWVFAVGRLDMASEGLLLLTNDTNWANGITDPVHACQKNYHVQIGALPTEQLLDSLKKGIIDPIVGWLCLSDVHVLRSGAKNCWLSIVLHEGKNRHIRRMFELLNIEVLRLVRVSIGGVSLGDLPKKEFRNLTQKEYASLCT